MLVRPNEQAASHTQFPLGGEKLFLSLEYKFKVTMCNGKGYPDTVPLHGSLQGLESLRPLASRADNQCETVIHA